MEQELNFRREPLGNGIFAFVNDRHGFGTDAILLADFAKIRKTDRACDIGTGCGIIPLLWCRDPANGKVFGVEVQPEAASLARKSAKENGLRGKFEVIEKDVRKLSGEIEHGSLTLLTLNPPYTASGAGLCNKDSARNTARHEIAGSLSELIFAGAKLLQTGGRFCLCSRPERLAEIIGILQNQKLEPKRLRLVSKRPGTAPWLFLLEAKKSAKAGLTVLPELFVHNEDGSYSAEMTEIYGCYRDGASK